MGDLCEISKIFFFYFQTLSYGLFNQVLPTVRFVLLVLLEYFLFFSLRETRRQFYVSDVISYIV